MNEKTNCKIDCCVKDCKYHTAADQCTASHNLLYLFNGLTAFVQLVDLITNIGLIYAGGYEQLSHFDRSHGKFLCKQVEIHPSVLVCRIFRWIQIGVCYSFHEL